MMNPDPILENLGDRYLDLPYQQQTQASPLLLQRLFNHTHRTPTFSGIHSKKKERKDLRLKDWKNHPTIYLQKENKEDQEQTEKRETEGEKPSLQSLKVPGAWPDSFLTVKEGEGEWIKGVFHFDREIQ